MIADSSTRKNQRRKEEYQIPELIGIDITGLAEVQKAFAKFGDLASPEASEAVSVYLLDVAKQYAPYKSITRKSVYGQSFKSDKQRRWFFAALNNGEISVPYNRSQYLAQSWKILGRGTYSTQLINDAPYAGYVKEEGRQNLLLKAMGWTTITQDVSSRSDKMLKTAEAAIRKTLKKAGLL